MNKKFLNMLGMCAKTGKCIFGETACLNAIRAGKAQMLFMDSDASDNTRKRFTNACIHKKVPLLEFDVSNSDAAKATGKQGYKLIAIQDKLFATQLFSILQSGESQKKAEVEQ